MVQAQSHACSLRGYAPSYCKFSTGFTVQRRIGSDLDVAECPKSGDSSVSVRPRWKQGAPSGNQTTSIGLSSPIQVTPSPVTVTMIETPVAQPTQGLRLG